MGRNCFAGIAGIDARAKLVFLIAFMVATLHARDALSLGVCFGLALCLSLMVRLPRSAVRGVLVPLLPIVVFTVVLQVLAYPEGTLLARLGGVSVTVEALVTSARMVVCLLALVLASVSFMRCTRAEELVFTLEWLLRPLGALGLRTDAFILSLSVTLGFLPVLVREFRGLRAAQMARGAEFEGSLATRVRAYARLFAPLFRSSFSHADCLADAFLARGFSIASKRATLYTGHFGWREGACLLLAALICVVCFA